MTNRLDTCRQPKLARCPDLSMLSGLSLPAIEGPLVHNLKVVTVPRCPGARGVECRAALSAHPTRVSCSGKIEGRTCCSLPRRSRLGRCRQPISSLCNPARSLASADLLSSAARPFTWFRRRLPNGSCLTGTGQPILRLPLRRRHNRLRPLAQR